MKSHRIHLSRSPTAVRIAAASESFVRETGPAAIELPPGSAAVNSDASGNVSVDAEPADIGQFLHETTQAIFDEIAESEQRRQQSIGELRDLAVEIASAIATHVVGDMLVRDQFPFKQLVEQAIEHLGVSQPGAVTFKLHPEDCQAFERAWNELEKGGAAACKVTWHADATLTRGSCEAMADERAIYIDIHDQLNQIRHELLETLDNAQIERRDDAPGDRHVQRYPNRRDTA